MMIPNTAVILLGLLIWGVLVLGLAAVSWVKITAHVKVYLLIVYNALFLLGVFQLFPLLKRLG